MKRRTPVIVSTVPVEQRGSRLPEYACPVEGVWTVDGKAYRLIIYLGRDKLDNAVLLSLHYRERGLEPVGLACEFYEVGAEEV